MKLKIKRLEKISYEVKNKKVRKNLIILKSAKIFIWLIFCHGAGGEAGVGKYWMLTYMMMQTIYELNKK